MPAMYALLALALAAAARTLPEANRVIPPNGGLVPGLHPFVKRMNLNGRNATLLARDQQRVRAMLGRANGSISDDVGGGSVAAASQVVQYIVNVGVGTPPTTYSLLVDTGSSNTWVGASTPFVPTSSSVKTADSVNVTYGTGSFLGIEFTDTLTLGNGLTVENQFIGVALESQGLDGLDGILGLGPITLNNEILSPNNAAFIPTVTNTLFSQGVIPEHLLAISFEPTTSMSIANGELSFGRIDPSKFTGEITYTPITQVFPANQFWGIDQSITYGASSTPILATTAGIVDTGTTLTLIASDAFAAYQKATGAVIDEKTGLLRLTRVQFQRLQSLFFTINGQSFEFTPSAQAFPRELNEVLGGDASNVFLVIGDVGQLSGAGVDFINGMSFLERFYSVFDTANQRVGLAMTPFTTEVLN